MSVSRFRGAERLIAASAAATRDDVEARDVVETPNGHGQCSNPTTSHD
jgi:hypothetical protein